MRLIGEVVDVSEHSGADDQGKPYHYNRVKVFDREAAEVVEARVGDRYGITPRIGDRLDAIVRVSAYRGRDGARLSVSLVRPNQVAPAAVPATKAG